MVVVKESKKTYVAYVASHMVAVRQELLHQAEERSTIPVYDQAAMGDAEHLQQQLGPLLPPALLKGQKSLKQSSYKLTQLQHRLHVVHLRVETTLSFWHPLPVIWVSPNLIWIQNWIKSQPKATK